MLRINAILLSLLILLSVVGPFPVFHVLRHRAQREIKHQIKSGVPKSELHTLAFHKSQSPQWVKKDREFRLNQTMYDVVHTLERGDSIIYQCVNDTQETALFKNLSVMLGALYANPNSDQSKQTKVVQNVLQFKYLQTSQHKSDLNIQNTIVFLALKEEWDSEYLAPDTPPPVDLFFI
ncbi:hypothetical protein GYB22_04915 [bacterium]|nr:hypothetical protein [bacterium]